MNNHVDFDIGIIGGGPAGSATAAYLAKAGLRCVVFERENFPRPHVGESLVPSSMRVFSDLNLLDQMEAAGFPRKYGAVWTSADKGPTYQHDWAGLADGAQYAGIRFDERTQAGVDRLYTYHVDRGKFDQILLRNAGRLGATIYEGTDVSKVDFTDDRSVQIEFNQENQKKHVQVKMVVDASGRRTFLGNKMGLKVKDAHFDQSAVHTWFEGYDRKVLSHSPDQEDYIFIHFLPLQNAWVWAIPITDEITSIGMVAQKKHFQNRTGSLEELFWDFVKTRPEFCSALQKAKRIRPFSSEGDYSYAMKQICGDRFVLVGDAARFVDPIFSSGVSIALNSAKFASLDIIEATKQGDFSRERFASFEQTMLKGMKNWYRFISLYYRLNVMFTYFLKDKRYRLDILKLLQGDVYDDNPAVLDKMEEMVIEVENDKHHPWHPVLGELACKEFEPALPL
ncbi:MAG: NAD(P)/FAD-dependent oxidoreductase [Chloroflexota bacterium]